jgi:hypothetical protein
MVAWSAEKLDLLMVVELVVEKASLLVVMMVAYLVSMTVET